MNNDNPEHLLSTYDGFISQMYIELEEAKDSHFEMIYGKEAQKLAIEHVIKCIEALKKEQQKIRKMVNLLYE